MTDYRVQMLCKGERRKQNFAIKREQRKFIYSAEREQSQDRKAGLKEKGERGGSEVGTRSSAHR